MLERQLLSTHIGKIGRILKKYNYADEVKEFVEAGKVEADLYNRFKDYYSYVFYIAKKK